ncbi:hypothetical protein [Parendozoicomonas haliclonae]|uniref:Uncharacterized protein n=1 Tax=Parendozoicomonas haliclonae TaxID=1960125 RepID=A0A1X7APC3_9GAMM|nr:hypothetical protein [Parendozoicomonas haliclonae]SMA50154.1 hypothetical protein EHSB41UT_03945 [Parendozoicomonas haliclonae]
MNTIKSLFLLSSLAVTTTAIAELEPFTDDDLSNINGAGISFYTDNLSLDTTSDDPDKAGKIVINTNEFNEITLKNLQINKSGTTTKYSEGASIGSLENPLTFRIVEKVMPDGQRRDVAILDMPENADALDIRYDSYFRPILVDENGMRSSTPNERLFAQMELEGTHLNGSHIELWATEEEGISLATNLSLEVDSLNISADSDSKASIKGLKLTNLRNGSIFQPLHLRIVEEPSYYLPEGTSELQMKMVSTLQLEVAPLTPELATLLYTNPEDDELYSAEEYRTTLTDISIQQLNFKNQQITGYLDGIPQYAFIPQNPNENVMDIQGMEIQSMRVTFHDLPY